MQIRCSVVNTCHQSPDNSQLYTRLHARICTCAHHLVGFHSIEEVQWHVYEMQGHVSVLMSPVTVRRHVHTLMFFS